MKGKKILSLVLSLVLVVAVIGVMPAKAADYTSTQFTGIADAPNWFSVPLPYAATYLSINSFAGPLSALELKWDSMVTDWGMVVMSKPSILSMPSKPSQP